MTDLNAATGHSRTITAFFESKEAADNAVRRLEQAGIPNRDIDLVPGNDATATPAAEQGPSFWESLKDLFLPDEDRHVYAEGLRRGGYLLSVKTDESTYSRVLDIVDVEGSVDMDQRESSWKSEGWSGFEGAPANSYGSGAATGAGLGAMGATAGAMGAASTATGASTAAGFGSTSSGSASTGGGYTGMGARSANDDMRTGEVAAEAGKLGGRSAESSDRSGLAGARATQTTTKTGALGARSTGAGASGTHTGSFATGAQTGERDEAIPVYEENLRVGKRDVNHGRVRVRSYVVETPVNEQVTLHSERVQVDRRPVDRPVSASDALFTERTIEAEEHAEEAVVSKDVRVKEEISLRKTAEDQVRNIQETTRRTEVEIEDGGRQGAVGGAGRFAGDAKQIREHMDVYASDGVKIGTVDHLEGGEKIKLTKTSAPDGQHHFVPLAWVDRVDNGVHLAKAAAEVRAGW